MPLYEYTCKSCEHSFETLVYDGEEVECPKCDSRKVSKLLSLPGVGKPTSSAFPSACGDPSLPPCGAVGCRRTGKG